MINGQQCERGGRNVQLREDLQQVPHLLVKMLAGHCRQTEEVLPLPGPDDDGDARSETRDDGIGNELDDRPETRDAESSRITPASSVAICSPSMPYRAVMPDRMTTNAPVGPAICSRLPPNTETARPATMAV
jgi:hypothetical protein